MAILLAGNDVYFATVLADATQASVLINGRAYFRFMDFIYVPTETEELTPDQVAVVNTLRHRYRRRISLTSNEYVRKIFRSVANEFRPNELLEVGAGFSPLVPPDFAARYLCVDINPAVIPTLRGRGYDAAVFGVEDDLPLVSGSVDLTVAVFVFHFGLSYHQIEELARTLRPDGFFMGNVYRRSAQSRLALREQFARAGLTVTTVLDDQAMCKEHEFWLATLNSRKAELVTQVLITAMQHAK